MERKNLSKLPREVKGKEFVSSRLKAETVPVNMELFGSDNKGNNDNQGGVMSSTASKSTTPMIVVYWNIAFATVVGLPILLCMTVHVLSRGGGGGGEEGWWDAWFDGPEEEKWQGVGSFFAYLWGLLVFSFLYWRGKKVLEKQSDIRTLFVALAVFANLAFLCWILTATTRQREGGGEDGAWISQPSAVQTLTFFFMTVFSVAFSIILHGKVRVGSSSSSYSLWGEASDANTFM